MGMTIQYAPTSPDYSGDTDRAPSPAIWADCPIEEIHRLGIGWGFHDDFIGFEDPTTAKAYGKYLKLDTGDCTLSGSPEKGGAIKLFGTTDNEDCGIKLGDASSAPFLIPANSGSIGKLWFECRIKKSTIADAKAGFFVGLADEAALAANFIADAGNDFADNDLLGFWNDETDDSTGSHVHIVTQKSGAAFDTIVDTAAELAADTYVKLGFKYDPSAPADKRITFYVNGLDVGTYVGENSGDATVYLGDTTNFPGGEEMAPICYLNMASTDDVSVYMDWWRCYQLAE